MESCLYIFGRRSCIILQTDAHKGLFGPGHNSFFKDDNGNDLVAYHARPYDELIGDPLYDPNRHCYIMKLEWNNDVPLCSFENNVSFSQ